MAGMAADMAVMAAGTVAMVMAVMEAMAGTVAMVMAGTVAMVMAGTVAMVMAGAVEVMVTITDIDRSDTLRGTATAIGTVAPGAGMFMATAASHGTGTRRKQQHGQS